MEEFLTSIVYVLAIGSGAGYFMGYFIKKLWHLALTIGVFAFLFMYMVYTGTIDLNIDELIATVTNFTDILGPLGFATLASSTPFIGGFAVGMILGFRRG